MPRDLHVVSLVYRLETGEGLSFDNPPRLSVDTADFSGELESATLTLTMKSHYPSIDEAKRVVEPFLRSWELAEWLRYAQRVMWFTFEKGEMIDRSDPKATIATLDPLLMTWNVVPVVLKVTRLAYPAPPHGFVASGDVQVMWSLYEQMSAGRVRITDAAYFILTTLESRPASADDVRAVRLKGDRRKRVAARYQVDFKVLDTLGRFVSTRGDERTSRKYPPSGRFVPLEEQELRWMKDAVRALIQRVGEYDAGAPLRLLTMVDLPPLPPESPPA